MKIKLFGRALLRHTVDAVAYKKKIGAGASFREMTSHQIVVNRTRKSQGDLS